MHFIISIISHSSIVELFRITTQTSRHRAAVKRRRNNFTCGDLLPAFRWESKSRDATPDDEIGHSVVRHRIICARRFRRQNLASCATSSSNRIYHRGWVSIGGSVELQREASGARMHRIRHISQLRMLAASFTFTHSRANIG